MGASEPTLSEMTSRRDVEQAIRDKLVEGARIFLC